MIFCICRVKCAIQIFYLSEKLRVIVAIFFETVLQLFKVFVLFIALRAHAFILIQTSLMERMHAQKVNGGQIQSFATVRTLHLLEDTSTICSVSTIRITYKKFHTLF